MTTDVPRIVEVDCSTGLSTDRDMTPAEIEAHLAIEASLKVRQAEEEAAAEAKAAAKASAEAKLAALGLSAEEIAAL
jgi:hypothetical protein